MAFKVNKWMGLAVVVLGLTLAATSTATAQQRRGRGLFSINRVQLATLEKVQTDLHMTDAQKKSATEISEKLVSDRRELVQNNSGGDFAQLREKFDKLTSEATEKFTATLDDAQRTRLTEIFAQVNGAAALSDSAVAKALKITDQQAGELTKVRQENLTAFRNAFQDLQNASVEERREKMNQLRKEGDEKQIAVLTADQREALTKLKGKEIELDLSSLFPRRNNN